MAWETLSQVAAELGAGVVVVVEGAGVGIGVVIVVVEDCPETYTVNVDAMPGLLSELGQVMV